MTESALLELPSLDGANSRLIIEQKKEELEEALTSPVNDTDLITRVSNELNSAYIAEEAYWRQRSRLLWLSLGDRNTGFFHATAKNRKRANAFSVIEDEDGTSIYQEDQIGKVIVKYFQKLFSSVDGQREETVQQALSPMVTSKQNEGLIRTPSATEIKEAAFAIHADKAPGPDGFSAGFYHSNWDTVGMEIVKVSSTRTDCRKKSTTRIFGSSRRCKAHRQWRSIDPFLCAMCTIKLSRRS